MTIEEKAFYASETMVELDRVSYEWLIERAKRANLLEKEFQGIAESAYKLKQELDGEVEED
ncbi:hypothetical protein [Bacillus sp. SDLI1]|uniref:hypothetical protein n=1 Tax=Bacillus sp. SDLI1 TaxID=1774743 RepID=UPI000767FFCD|nr:hypothetical protein [Bacillus sp. SDLI1]AME04855.1 hypothetical protein AUL54_00215 [Bacillus sp. SDLI1]